MRIILSPAKKMNIDTDSLAIKGYPKYLNRTEEILAWLQSKTPEELQILWECNDKIARQNIDRLKDMNLYDNLTPAILSYEGIAYQYMAPAVFENSHFDYVQEHLRIISAFYGVLKPMDGVTPYRLELKAKARINDTKNLYEFWGKEIYDEVTDESGIIINLASNEYSSSVIPYIKNTDRFITISFVEKSVSKLITKGTYAKMARGEMVRFMAENNIENPNDIKKFNRLGYVYRDDLSDDNEFIFERVVAQTQC